MANEDYTFSAAEIDKHNKAQAENIRLKKQERDFDVRAKDQKVALTDATKKLLEFQQKQQSLLEKQF